MAHQAGAAAYISVKQTAGMRREIRRTELDVIFKRLYQDRYIDIGITGNPAIRNQDGKSVNPAKTKVSPAGIVIATRRGNP